MSISQLPSGRWRAQVHDPSVGHNVSVSKVLGGPGTFATKREAKAARETARAKLDEVRGRPVTVLEWWTTWTTDPLWRRPKDSTNNLNAERTSHFAKAHANVPISSVNDDTISLWLRGGKRNSQVPPLRAMFNDAARPAAGRLIDRNPFAGLGISRGTGNRDKQPPSEALVHKMIGQARELGSASFADWLTVACFTGMRPGELDALSWDCVDFNARRIRVERQFSAHTGTFTSPKNGRTRWALLTPPAYEALQSQLEDGKRSDEFCFVSSLGNHFTGSSRDWHWKAVRAASGWKGSLYLATRHFAGWYMRNVLRLDSEDVAVALGHTDGGELVRRLYGHLDDDLALRRVADAYAQQSKVVHVDFTKKGEAS